MKKCFKTSTSFYYQIVTNCSLIVPLRTIIIVKPSVQRTIFLFRTTNKVIYCFIQKEEPNELVDSKIFE